MKHDLDPAYAVHLDHSGSAGSVHEEDGELSPSQDETEAPTPLCWGSGFPPWGGDPHLGTDYRLPQPVDDIASHVNGLSRWPIQRRYHDTRLENERLRRGRLLGERVR